MMGRVISEYGNPTHLVRAVGDNDYNTFYAGKGSGYQHRRVGGQPTRVDAIFVKGKGITRRA